MRKPKLRRNSFLEEKNTNVFNSAYNIMALFRKIIYEKTYI